MKNLLFDILISLFLPPFFHFSCSMPLIDPSSHHTHPRNQCLDDQQSCLMQLQHDLYDAPNSSKFELWDPNNDCCSWEGVTCDVVGHVIGLDLSYKDLSGSFHSIFNLHHLRRLNLAGNNFNATLSQYGFAKLPNLTHLNLSALCYGGQIPMEISNLSMLVSLDLSNQVDCSWRNDQSGDSFDPTLRLKKPNLKTLIKNMRSLRELYLDDVDISSESSSKWCETTSLSLPKLSVLSMPGCGLTGPLCSSLFSLPHLSILNLDDNPIPYFPPNFSKISPRLVSLSLSRCNLSGHFPTEFFFMPKIQKIDISENYQLKGQLPEFPINHTSELRSLTLESCNFSGPIPASIANLSNLVELDLRSNNFNGLIPPFHSSGVPNLQFLYLCENKLSGSIPSSLFTLPALDTLSLGYNQLVGEIDELSNASSSLIELLDIGYNSLSKVKLDMFFQLNKLRYLDLSNNSLLTGGSHTNQSLTSFPQLEELYLRSCNLTEFPEFIKTQDKLGHLDLSNNQIHGLVPNWLWKSTLTSVDLSSNAIDFPTQIPFDDANSSFPMLSRLDLRSCNVSVFPVFLKTQENLDSLDLSNNSLTSLDQFSSNHSPPSSQETPICNLSQLHEFNASYNQLSGSIPSCLGNISTLRYLDLQQNNFSGSIPDFGGTNQLIGLQLNENKLEGKLPRSIANCTSLRVLNVANNCLHDTFPLWLGKLPALQLLILRANGFHGPIQHLKNNFPMLDVLDIASNNFSGQLSTKFFQATHQIRSLKIGGNKLEGKLPRSLANCTNLEVLDLGKNMIRDTFPFWLVKLPFLKVLILRSNKFYGSILFSEDGHFFPMLHILDLASNNFSGELSVEFFQSLRAMMVINGSKAKIDYDGERDYPESYYQDSVTIVNRGFEMSYQKILTLLTCLDLSNNSFHGRILEEIQDLKSLHVLNLSYNGFFESIPSALGSLAELESLDLSSNNLSGKIPPHLTSLTFLAVLNVSYNQLEGSIPQSYQFGTFSNDSYVGNPRLCGLPLTKKCNEVGFNTLPLMEDEDSRLDSFPDWKIVLIGSVCGLVIGFFMGYTVLSEFGNAWNARIIRNWSQKLRRSR